MDSSSQADTFDRRRHRGGAKPWLKILSGLGLFVILVAQVWSMSQWNESRGVWDDVCYLRQAHLFQRFGLDGLNTDISRDDDRYVSTKLKEIGYPTWSDPTTAPCHIFQPATQKLVMQYPPGTGLVLALFPPGFQVIPLYVLATIAVFGFGLLAIARATSIRAILMAAAFADVAVYLMINPTKASFSMAPTMVVCALGGFLTARLFAVARPRHGFALTLATGFVIGLAVNFRLPNLLLSAGYFVAFLFAFLGSKKPAAVVSTAAFGIAFLVGMAPTLLANAINAGSPFTTTYGGGDVAPPELNIGVFRYYVTDMQFALLVLAGAWAAFVFRRCRDSGIRQVALIVAVNLVVNSVFFLSHPLFTPYYTIPVAMLSLWSLLFASLLSPAAVSDGTSGSAGALR